MHILYMETDVPTISRMRVSVDETGVKYLLSKRSNEFICSLKDKDLMTVVQQHFYSKSILNVTC